MGRRAAARKLATAAVYGGGGLSLLSASLYGLLRLEAMAARRIIGPATGPVYDPSGWYGLTRPGPGLRMVLLGDSSAAGYGVEDVTETTGAVLGSMLARETNRRVWLHSYAVVGAQSSDLAPQVAAALTRSPQVAVILVGANDVTHAVRPSASVRYLADAVRQLQAHNVAVVVGTCPDLGTIRPIPQPLRAMSRLWSRRLAAAQTIAVVEAGARAVSLTSVLGQEFDAAPALLFGPDQFHPSAMGYAALASVLVPSVVAALGLGSDEDALEPIRGEGVLPISTAAVAAAAAAGAEVRSAAPTRRRSKRRRDDAMVTLRRRRRPAPVEAESPTAEENPEVPEAPDSPDDELAPAST